MINLNPPKRPKRSRVAAQVNGIPPCPIWTKASGPNVETDWLFCDPYNPPQINFSAPPDLIVLQCAIRWYDLHELGWHKLRCPIVASCGDASVLCNLDAVFRNLPLLSRLYVEGYDYIDKYFEWCRHHKVTPTPDRLIYQHLCADNHFQPLPSALKIYDWCFLGQAYQSYDVRLKHHRRAIIPELLQICPNAYVSGPDWLPIIGEHWRGDWVDQSCLNAIYNQSVVVVSIDAHDGAGYTSTRTIEAMHAGHCVMIYDHAGMGFFKRWVRDEKHALFFSTPAEFKQKLQVVKENRVIADNIGIAARELILERGWTSSAWMADCLSLLR